MEANIIILAHPRSGSTSLRDVFDLHPRISISNEPFNPTRRTLGWGHDFLADLSASGTLNQVLSSISRRHNGAKHLLGQLTVEQDLEVLSFFKTKYFLVRRNQLRAVVSCLIAKQTSQWHRRGDSPIGDCQLAPIEPAIIDAFLLNQAEQIRRVQEHLRQTKTPCTVVYYEDLFAEDLLLSDRIEKVLQLIRPVIDGDLTGPFIRSISAKLDHDSNKVNSSRTYQLLPNLDEINRVFGSGEYGDPLE
tara:strand:+ start:457 stop:1197 length:741 start_codon:yes stop_codon:yes gene_type:complete